MSYYVVDAEMGLPWDVAEAAEGMRVRTVARCPTRDAAEAARRLLSGECARAKEEPPLPVCGVCSGGVCSEWCGYEAGKADGAAQERAKIVKWLTLHGQLSLARFIERGEAGE